jgi:putative peptidoglycan lipid II flippase
MGGSALSALLGFAREIISAHYYGTRAEMDAFVNASTIPTILFGVFNGALVAALVPTLSEYMASNRPDEVRKLGSTVINVLFLVLSAVAIAGWLLAPLFVPLIARGFPKQEQSLVVEMVRWMMPGIIATSLGGVCAALLNANHRFIASSLVWVSANVVTIACVIALHKQLGIFALALGTVCGLFAQLLVQVPAILKEHLYRFELNLHHPGLAKTWALLVPVTIGSGATQINVAFDRYFASTLTAGSTAGLGYTTKLAFLPVPIIAGAIATVIFPMIARQFASSDREGVARNVVLALKMVTFIVLPCAVALWILAFPIVQTLFERGAFGPSATHLCASLVPFACLPLIATSYVTVLARACYGCKEVRLAVVGSISTVVLNIALSATFLPFLGARGLLLANGLAGVFLSLYLFTLLRRLIGGFDWKPIAWSILKVSLASLVMGTALHSAFVLFANVSPFLRPIRLAALISMGAVVFLGSSRILRVDEFSTLVTLFRHKIAPLKS